MSHYKDVCPKCGKEEFYHWDLGVGRGYRHECLNCGYNKEPKP